MNGRATAFAMLALAFSASGGPPARAEPPKAKPIAATAPAPVATPAASCVLRGIAEPRANAGIEDAQGRLIARFSGSATLLSASEFPADARGRVRVETGTGSGSFRIRGYALLSDLPLYSATTIPVATAPKAAAPRAAAEGALAPPSGHVSIPAGRSLSLLSSTKDLLRVEKRLVTPLSQSFTAWAPCSSVGFGPITPQGYSPPGGARGYVLKADHLELYDRPGGVVITTLHRAPDGEGVLFFSTERQKDWVRVSHHGEIVVEAWARAQSLVALPRGETMDQLASRSVQRGPARLAIQGEPRVVKPSRDVALRAAARDADPPIGVIEREAETYVLDVVAGWASVVPKSLNVVPPPDRQFWAKASELGVGASP